MTTFFQDLRYALRLLAKNPTFTAIAVLTLALGIGANTAIFSLFEALVLTGLHVNQADQLVALAFRQKKIVAPPVFSYPDLKDISEQVGGSMEVFAYRFGIDGLSDGGHADRVIANYVTGNYFSALGVKPAAGRLILPAEGSPGRTDPVLVLGYSYWKSRFGGRPEVIGRQVEIDGHPLTIVGVTSREFHGLLNEVDIQAYIPLNMNFIEFGLPLDSRVARGLFALARLKHGTTLEQARGTLQVVAARLSRQYPKTDAEASIEAYPQKEAALTPMPVSGLYRKELMVMGLFLSLAALVLLMACFNVANILLVRATAREHEMAVRAALGAPRHRLIRQFLTETLLLALFGCAAGLLLGAWASAALASIHVSLGLPVNLNFSLDRAVLAYALAAAAMAGLVVGILPALRAARAHPGSALHEGGRTVTGGHHRLRSGLVVAQVAASMVILITAGLFTRSLLQAQRMDLGFNPDHLANFHIDPHEIGYNDAQGQEFYQALLQSVRALPGVQSAALAFTFPSNGVYQNAEMVFIEGHLPPGGQPPPVVSENVVSTGYFDMMGIALVEGRPFADTDTTQAPRVAIINQAMAREFWPHENPIGKRFSTGGSSNPSIEVVGVARDSKYGDLFRTSEPYLFLPLTQNYLSIQTLQVRSLLPPATLEREVENQIHALAPGLPVFDVQTMREALDGGGFYTFRMGAYLAAALGLLGLVLATVGVYGVIAFSTSQKMHEFGVRLALGAHPRDIWRIVFGHGMSIVGAGVVLGLTGAFLLARAMASFLYGVSTHDPITYLSVTVLISAAAMLACYFPARRATQVDPMVALRYE